MAWRILPNMVTLYAPPTFALVHRRSAYLLTVVVSTQGCERENLHLEQRRNPGVFASEPAEVRYVDLLFRHRYRGRYRSERRGHHAAGSERTEIPPLK